MIQFSFGAFVVFCLASISGVSGALAAPSQGFDSRVPNFKIVTGGQIYRGAEPGLGGLTALRDQWGVKTDLNLEVELEDGPGVSQDLRNAAKLGMRPIHEPLSAFLPPARSRINRILNTLADPGNYPIYVHCKHGEDRTGLVIALHRVKNQGWTPQAAYEEMMKNGFHRSLFFLYLEFKQLTGFDD